MPEATIRTDEWLSEICGYPVFRVDASADVSIEQVVREHMRSEPRAFYYIKVDAEAVGTMRALVAAGFCPVDVNVLFASPSADIRTEPAEGIAVAQAHPTQRDSVLAIAETCFRYSRFHLDPQFPKALANRIKRAWIANYFDGGRGDRLFVATRGHRPIGFLAALRIERPGGVVAVIDLVGVEPQSQGLGAGSSLVAAFAEFYRTRCERLEVGTQLANTPSIRLYQRAGFSLSSGKYVLHMHRGA
jgi:GNAT superfamily N-acetyltransferase